MMTKIREKTHLLLYVLIFCFVGLIVIEWGANYSDTARTTRGVIGKIDGDDIRYADFQTAYFNQIQQMQQKKDGESLSESEMEMISDQIWNQMIEETLLRNFINKNDIAVGDSEVVFHLRNNPPDFLKQSPSFQTDGAFDANKYVQALSNPAYAKEWAQIENILRMQLPYSKLQSMIVLSARVSDAELRQEYARRNLKVNGQLIFFSPSEFSANTIDVSDDELKAYYEAHIDEYKEPEKARLAYVNFSDAATKDDSAEVFARLDDISKQIKDGKDFADLAKMYSTEPGASKSGGELGWFTRGRMVAEFEEACFDAKAGDIVGPILTQFGYHIIKIEETKFKDKKKKSDAGQQDSVKASHILIKMEASPTTIETVRENANAFYELAKDGEFDEAVEKYSVKHSLRVDTTAEMLNNEFGMVAGFPDRLKNVVRFAFNEEIGSTSKPHRTSLGFTIFKTISRSKAEIKSLEAVKDRVKNAVLEEKRKDMAFSRAQEYRTKMTSMADIKKIDTTFYIRDLNNFTINNSIPGVGRDAKLAGALFQLPLSLLSEPVKGTRGAYLVQIFTRDEFNESKYQAAREELKRQLINTKQQRAYRDWLEAYRKGTSIEDFRAEFNL
ncbi:peptidylprolyl isomerase [bacterium]|nr:peptidylprolyl isomerase [bacterium]